MLIHHSPLACITFQGSKVLDFLQGMLTTDVKKLSKTQSLPTALCQYQGKMMGYGYLSLKPDSIHLYLPQSTCQNNLERLTPYAQLNKITCSIPQSIHNIGIISPSPLYDCDQPYQTLAINDDCTLICLTTKPFAYALIGPEAAIHAWIDQQDASPTMQDTWMACLIANQEPILESVNQGLFTPNMLGLVPSQAVSTNKGCYLGQEIIARTHHLGQAKKKLMTFSTEQIPAQLPSPGDRIPSQATNASESASLGTCLQACVFDGKFWCQMVTPLTDYQPLFHTSATQQD